MTFYIKFNKKKSIVKVKKIIKLTEFDYYDIRNINFINKI